MFENIMIGLIVSIALYFVIRHMKRVMTVGEGGKKCANCPVNREQN